MEKLSLTKCSRAHDYTLLPLRNRRPNKVLLTKKSARSISFLLEDFGFILEDCWRIAELYPAIISLWTSCNEPTLDGSGVEHLIVVTRQRQPILKFNATHEELNNELEPPPPTPGAVDPIIGRFQRPLVSGISAAPDN
jgi:hypothetical protein